uniref:Uncharacterized protein n=1 Tax=Anguilla anguilla TaxID=7936 RepID=A0A0E9S086_ANGAN
MKRFKCTNRTSNPFYELWKKKWLKIF